jgi:hypothetical protein
MLRCEALRTNGKQCGNCSKQVIKGRTVCSRHVQARAFTQNKNNVPVYLDKRTCMLQRIDGRDAEYSLFSCARKRQEKCLVHNDLQAPNTKIITIKEKREVQGNITSTIANTKLYHHMSLQMLHAANRVLKNLFPDTLLMVKGGFAMRIMLIEVLQHLPVPEHIQEAFKMYVKQSDLDTALIIPSCEQYEQKVKVIIEFVMHALQDWLDHHHEYYNLAAQMIEKSLHANNFGNVKTAFKKRKNINITNVDNHVKITHEIPMTYALPATDIHVHEGLYTIKASIDVHKFQVCFDDDGFVELYDAKKNKHGEVHFTSLSSIRKHIRLSDKKGTKCQVIEHKTHAKGIKLVFSGSVPLVAGDKVVTNGINIGKVVSVRNSTARLDKCIYPRVTAVRYVHTSKPNSVILSQQKKIVIPDKGADFALLRVLFPIRITKGSRKAWSKAELLDISIVNKDDANIQKLQEKFSIKNRDKYSRVYCRETCVRFVNLTYQYDDLERMRREDKDMKSMKRLKRLEMLNYLKRLFGFNQQSFHEGLNAPAQKILAMCESEFEQLNTQQQKQLLQIVQQQQDTVEGLALIPVHLAASLKQPLTPKLQTLRDVLLNF